MADTLKTMPIASLTDVMPDTNDKMVMYRDSDESAHVTTVGELSEGMNANISDAFSSSASYAVGDYCIYNDTLYKCTTAHSGSWSASDFEAVTVANELSELNTNIETITKTGNTLSSNNASAFEIDVTKNGYKPVGIIGYRLYSGSNFNTCNLYGCYISDNLARVLVSNYGSSTASFAIDVTVLYQRA